jgi:hypothetical protein
MPASDKYAAMTVSWHDGSKDGKPNQPEMDPRLPDVIKKVKVDDKEVEKKVPFGQGTTSGMMFIGTDGVIADKEAYCGDPQIYPKERADDVKKMTEDGKIKQTEARSPVPGNPQLEWAHCIGNETKPSSNFDYSAPLTEFVALGNLALRCGQPIQWDSPSMKVTNVEAANKYVKRAAYRPGW